ncbi:DNA-directed RNA polymerase N-terminal domain-containing protein, partial [Gymnopilus junonius]
MWDWHIHLREQVKLEIQKIDQEDTKKRQSDKLVPYLTLVNPDRLSLLAILGIMRMQGSGGVLSGMKMTHALIAFGKAIENEHKAQI